jgi:hypothetical protein
VGGDVVRQSDYSAFDLKERIREANPIEEVIGEIIPLKGGVGFWWEPTTPTAARVAQASMLTPSRGFTTAGTAARAGMSSPGL